MRFLSLNVFEDTLKPVAPFDFSKSLEFLSDFSPMKNEQEVKNGTITKAVQTNGKTIAFEVSDQGTIENPKLKFTAYSESKITNQDKTSIADRISFFLSLQDNLKEFYEIAQTRQMHTTRNQTVLRSQTSKVLDALRNCMLGDSSPKNTPDCRS